MGKKLVPELRFPEFSGEWEDKNLGDVLIERNVKCKDGDYEVISSTTNGLYYQKDYFNRDIASDDKSGYKILEKEQIVFSPQNLWMGNINFNDSIDIGIVSPSYKIYDIKKNYYPYFIKHIIKTPYMMYQYLQSSEQGASVVRRNLNIELFYSCKVSIPSIEEQKKLASFFNLIDKKIEKQEEKIASMEEYKKGMMQKLFPKKGENVPELRFKGFTDPWELRKLGEVAKYRNGKAHENDISDSGEYIVVNSKFVSTDGEVQKYSEKQIEPLYKDEIAFVLSDVPNGRAIARTFLVDKDDRYTLNQRIAGITTYEKTSSYFLYILMNRNRYFLQFDDGAKQTNLSLNDVMEFEESYPSYEEQVQIGTFFDNLDNLITLHQRKLGELKELKKGFMQKMFI